MSRGALRRVLRRGGGEHGAVLVIVAGCLVLFLGLLAYTIDLGSGRQGQQKAQEVADAAAEAGANAIPYPACTAGSTTCIANVQTQASTIATANGACAACVVVNYPYMPSANDPDYTRIQVLVHGDSAGTTRSSIAVAASAIASAQTTTSTSTSLSKSTSTSTSLSTSTSVTPPTNTTPSAIFASDSSCSDAGLTIGENLTGTSPANNVNLQGSIYSNSGIGVYAANGNFGAKISYGPGSGCSYNHSSGNANYNGGAPVQASADYPFPDDFRNDTITCDQQAPTFSWTGTNLNLSSSTGTTYCATQSITIDLASSGSNLNASGVTFVAPQVTISASNCNLSPDPSAPDDLEIFNEGSSALTIDCNSNLNLGGGAIFSPTSPIDITALNFNNSEFIEGYQVHLALTDGSGDEGSINVSGDGDASGPGSTATTSTTVSTYSTSSTITSTLTNTTTKPDGSALSG